MKNKARPHFLRGNVYPCLTQALDQGQELGTPKSPEPITYTDAISETSWQKQTESKQEKELTKWRIAREHDNMSRCTPDCIPHLGAAL